MFFRGSRYENLRTQPDGKMDGPSPTSGCRFIPMVTVKAADVRQDQPGDRPDLIAFRTS